MQATLFRANRGRGLFASRPFELWAHPHPADRPSTLRASAKASLRRLQAPSTRLWETSRSMSARWSLCETPGSSLSTTPRILPSTRWRSNCRFFSACLETSPLSHCSLAQLLRNRCLAANYARREHRSLPLPRLCNCGAARPGHGRDNTAARLHHAWPERCLRFQRAEWRTLCRYARAGIAGEWHHRCFSGDVPKHS